MSEIKFPPLLEILRKRLQAESDASLSDSIVPVMVLEADRPEWPYLAGELRMATTVATTLTGAGSFAHAQLLNPAGSNIIAVVEYGELVQSCAAATFGPSTYLLGRLDAALSGLNLVGGPVDTRWDSQVGTNRRGQCQFRTQTNATAIVDVPLLRIPATFGAPTAASAHYACRWDLSVVKGIVLGPGTGIVMYTNAQSASQNNFQWTYTWRERQMSSWERQAIPGG